MNHQDIINIKLHLCLARLTSWREIISHIGTISKPRRKRDNEHFTPPPTEHEDSKFLRARNRDKKKPQAPVQTPGRKNITKKKEKNNDVSFYTKPCVPSTKSRCSVYMQQVVTYIAQHFNESKS